jgi:hypothetical protein
VVIFKDCPTLELKKIIKRVTTAILWLELRASGAGRNTNHSIAKLSGIFFFVNVHKNSKVEVFEFLLQKLVLKISHGTCCELDVIPSTFLETDEKKHRGMTSRRQSYETDWCTDPVRISNGSAYP